MGAILINQFHLPNGLQNTGEYKDRQIEDFTASTIHTAENRKPKNSSIR